MAAPATARVESTQRSETIRFWVGIALTVVINLITIAFFFGTLSQQVHDLDHDLENLRQDVRELRQVHHP